MSEEGLKVIYKCKGHVVADEGGFVDFELDEANLPMLVEKRCYGSLGNFSKLSGSSYASGLADEMYKEIFKHITQKYIHLCEYPTLFIDTDTYIEDCVELTPRFKVVIEKLDIQELETITVDNSEMFNLGW